MGIQNYPRTGHGRGVRQLGLAWVRNTSLLNFSQLPNSTGAGGADIENYSGLAISSNYDIWIAGAGGHNNADNRVVKYIAGVDSPTGWVQKSASSAAGVDNAAYWADGLPGACHTYDWTFVSVVDGKVYRIGAFGLYAHASAANTIDSYKTTIGSEGWDPAGTNPYTYGNSLTNLSSNAGAFQDESTGYFFWQDQINLVVNKWRPGQSTVTPIGTTVKLLRTPTCWDTTRNSSFALQWGDGWDAGIDAYQAIQNINPSSGSPTARTITINASSALTTFSGYKPFNCGMAYDRLRDRYVFACGTVSGGRGTVSGPLALFDIIPNSGTNWDMEVLTPLGGNPGSIPTAGLNGRIKYVESAGMGGLLIMCNATSGLYFLRTT